MAATQNFIRQDLMEVQGLAMRVLERSEDGVPPGGVLDPTEFPALTDARRRSVT